VFRLLDALVIASEYRIRRAIAQVAVKNGVITVVVRNAARTSNDYISTQQIQDFADPGYLLPR
jgi:hypothetical protein